MGAWWSKVCPDAEKSNIILFYYGQINWKRRMSPFLNIAHASTVLPLEAAYITSPGIRYAYGTIAT
jgi:hypothetical protein